MTTHPSAPSEPPSTPAEPPGGTVDIEGTESLSGFRALNPADGLFLRAEHLDTIQSYARSLVEATATATGSGVVHGLGTTVGTVEGRKVLRVSPGLAISPVGRLLRLGRGLSVTLDPTLLPPLQANGFWVVTLHFAAGTSGSAPVYGSLCHDTCSDGGSTIAPWRDEGVELRFTPDTMPGLLNTTRETCRNWLASAYFERERRAGSPWLVPRCRPAGSSPCPPGRGTTTPPSPPTRGCRSPCCSWSTATGSWTSGPPGASSTVPRPRRPGAPGWPCGRGRSSSPRCSSSRSS